LVSTNERILANELSASESTSSSLILMSKVFSRNATSCTKPNESIRPDSKRFSSSLVAPAASPNSISRVSAKYCRIYWSHLSVP
jgi:hypothetical protein